MTSWEFVRHADKESFARWLVNYTVAIIGIEEVTEEEFNDLIETTCQTLDEEVQTTTCEHHDISRED